MYHYYFVCVFIEFKTWIQRAWHFPVSHRVYTHSSHVIHRETIMKNSLFNRANAIKPCSINTRWMNRQNDTFVTYFQEESKWYVIWYIQLSNNVWISKAGFVCWHEITCGRARKWLIEPTCVRSAPRVRRELVYLVYANTCTNIVVFKVLFEPRGT